MSTVKRYVRWWVVLGIIGSCLVTPRAGAAALVRDITADDLANYSGKTLSATEAAAWGLFKKEAPASLGMAGKGIAAVTLHRQLQKGDLSAAAGTIVDYAIDIVLGEYQSAVGTPLASIKALADFYVAANDFIHDQYFIPTLVDGIYARYRESRETPNTHEQAWEVLQAMRMEPLIAKVLKEAVYPKHNLVWGDDDKSKATTWIEGKAGGRTIKIKNRHGSTWPYPQFRKFIIHTKKDRFLSVIDIDATGMENYEGYRHEVEMALWKLNEGYRGTPGYLDPQQMKAIEAKIAELAARLAAQEIGPRLRDEAVAYIGEMLQARYAREVFQREIPKLGERGLEDLERVVAELREFARKQGTEKKVPVPVVKDTGKMERERAAFVDAFQRYCEARLSAVQFRSANPGIVTKKELASRMRGPAGGSDKPIQPLGTNEVMATPAQEAQLVQIGESIGKAVKDRTTADRALRKHPLITAPIMRYAMGRVDEAVRETDQGFRAAANPRLLKPGEATARIRFLLKGDNSITASELAELVKQNTKTVRDALLKPETPPLVNYPPGKEGTKEVVLDNPAFKLHYDVEYRDGTVRLTGYYHTWQGKKVEYRSEPMHRDEPKSKGFHLFVTKAGTGYHVYRADSGDVWQPEDRATVIVTRMRGEEIEIIHRLDADAGKPYTQGFSLQSPGTYQDGPRDYWSVEYKAYRSDGSGGMERLRLD